jgi:hypothetical protein
VNSSFVAGVILFSALPFSGDAFAEGAYADPRLANLACWQIRALINPEPTGTIEIGSRGERWFLVYAVECTEKSGFSSCLGERDRFEHFFSAEEMDRFLDRANRSGCELKRGPKIFGAGALSLREAECLKHALLGRIQEEQGLTDHGVDLLRHQVSLPKAEFTMQCREEIGKNWFRKKYESWFSPLAK